MKKVYASRGQKDENICAPKSVFLGEKYIYRSGVLYEARK
jgi:hypothetical protein